MAVSNHVLLPVLLWTVIWNSGCGTQHQAEEVEIFHSDKQAKLGWKLSEPPKLWNEVSLRVGSQGAVPVLQACGKKVRKTLVGGWMERGDARHILMDIAFAQEEEPTGELGPVQVHLFDLDSPIQRFRRSAAVAELQTAAPFPASEMRHVSNHLTHRAALSLGQVSRRGFQLAFSYSGTCVMLTSIRLYYLRCPDAKLDLVSFGAAAAGSGPLSGSCVDGAVGLSPPVGQCGEDGVWDLLQGGCTCGPGHQIINNTCQACRMGHYKDANGTAGCQPCPANSRTHSEGSAACDCLPGYKRLPSDPEDLGCTRPPSAPVNVTARRHNDSALVVMWDPPLDTGGRPDMTFTIKCEVEAEAGGRWEACGDDVVLLPGSARLTNTSVSVMGLNPQCDYRLSVQAWNDISSLQGAPHSSTAAVTIHRWKLNPVVITVTQESNVKPNPAVITVTQESNVKPNPAVITVTQESNVKPNPAVITVTQESNVKPNPAVITVTQESNVKPNPAVITVAQESNVSSGNAIAAPQTGSRSLLWLTVGALLGSLLLIAVIPTVVFCLRQNYSKLRSEQEIQLLPINVGVSYGRPQAVDAAPEEPNVTEGMVHLLEGLSGSLLANLRDVLVERSQLTLGKELGKGEFGSVYEGVFSPEEGTDIKVAVKTMKVGIHNQDDLHEFLREAEIMKGFHHENVVGLLGVTLQREQDSPLPVPLVILPYMKHGDLRRFLIATRYGDVPMFVPHQSLLRFMIDISAGMDYLSSQGFLHRDLAARNCMLGDDLRVCVADFGLSKKIYSSNYYRQRVVIRVPIKWMAMESLSESLYTTKSDVWSFGVTMWEIVSRGRTPYPGVHNHELLDLLQSGHRLKPPEDCDHKLYEVMRSCWDAEPARRPGFGRLTESLKGLLSELPVLEASQEASYINQGLEVAAATAAATACQSPHTDPEGRVGNVYLPSPVGAAATAAAEDGAEEEDGYLKYLPGSTDQ